jgi:2-phospho-L-lactate guanylyltransferase
VPWSVVVPVKLLVAAKSRLGIDDALRRQDLALAMATDVVAAALLADDVDGVLVVTNDLRAAAALEPMGVTVVADASDAGLNAALEDGERAARGWWPRAGVAALSSDLPALRTEELSSALLAAGEHDRSLVADESGAGTTLLCARGSTRLAPEFGGRSRWRHEAAGAVALTGDWPTLRRDVDTPADLEAARALGVGAATVLSAG